MVVAGSMILGGWMAWHAAEPWADSAAAIARVEHEGSTFYHIDKRSDLLYDQVGRAVRAMRTKRWDKALSVIDACAKAEPTNCLFDLMKANTLWNSGKRDEAVSAVMASRTKPGMWLYATSHRDPADWQWDEVELICRCAVQMVDHRPADAKRFIAALVIGDRVIWSEPPSQIRIQQGITARQDAAFHIKVLAERAGNWGLSDMCDKLVREGRSFRFALSRKLARDGRTSLGTRAWAVERVFKERHRYSSAVTILQIDEQAQWTRDCRDEHITRGLADRVVDASEKL